MKSSMFNANTLHLHVKWNGNTGKDQHGDSWVRNDRNAWCIYRPEQVFSLKTEKPVIDYIIAEPIPEGIMCSGITHPYKHSA